MPQEMSEKNKADKTSPEAIIQSIQKMLEGLGTATGATASEGLSLPRGSAPVSPTPNITFDPRVGVSIQTAQPRPSVAMPRTGGESIGDFRSKTQATNAGLVSLGNSLSEMFNAAGAREHAKKANMAENYMMQINGLLASGDPNDKQKAMMILEDPKIRKILKTGLDYVPIEEEVPPEAQGVRSAVQKISGQGGGQQGGQQPQGQPQQPQRQPIIPQASQEQQLRAAMTSALLQKIKQDPASAITMMGQSQLSSAEKHADEFYKSGLGLSPAQIESMNVQEKLAGFKIYEQAIGAAIRGEVDMYKAGLGYKGKVDAATIMGNARKYAADAMKAAWAERDKKGGKGSVANIIAGARIYEDYAKKYLDIVKSGKTKDGIPLTDEQKKYYEQKADYYQRQADDYLNQAGDSELMDMFMKSVEEGPDATESDEPEE